MSHDSLVRMANQIGQFFESMPDRDEALENLAIHIQKFWAPPMRLALLAQVDGAHADDLRAIVRSALQRHRALLMPAASRSSQTRQAPASPPSPSGGR